MKNEIDAYIAAAPKEAQPHLRQLRAAIKDVAPKAVERISYGIVGYFYPTRLIYFGGAKKHVALYPAYDAKGLEKYRYGASTLRFPLDEPLPLTKIKALVGAEVKKRDVAGRAQGALLNGTASQTAPASRRPATKRSTARGGASSSRRASRS